MAQAERDRRPSVIAPRGDGVAHAERDGKCVRDGDVWPCTAARPQASNPRCGPEREVAEMTGTASQTTYDWRERRVYFDGAPEGMCWSVRQMFSYGTDLERFIPHLQAMAEGLERAHFTEYDHHPGTGYDADDNYGIFVVGLRPSTPDDKTEAQREKERKEREERETLVRLAAKYPDALTTGGSNERN